MHLPSLISWEAARWPGFDRGARRSRRDGMAQSLSTTFQQMAGAAFILSVLLGAMAFMVVLANSGEASGSVTAIASASLVTFIIGMLGLRRHVTDHGLQPLMLASIAAIAATIVGTTVRISGVALSVPVAGIAVVVIARSEWRLGDTGILAILAGLGTGAAYVLDAALHRSTGSYGDQGAAVLVMLGIGLSSLAVALLRDLPRTVRTSLIAAFVLTGISFVGLVGAFHGAAPLVLAFAAALLGGGAWIRLGVDLWQNERHPTSTMRTAR